MLGALAAIRHRDDSLEVFARADDDRVVRIRRNCVFGSSWCDWEQVAGGRTLASPAVVPDRFGAPELFVHGLDHRLYRTSVRDDRWQPWTEIPSPQLMRGSPSASRSGDGSPQVLFEGANAQGTPACAGTTLLLVLRQRKRRDPACAGTTWA